MPFADVRSALASVKLRAFENPGPLYNDARRSVLATWLDSIDRNLEDAQRALAVGTDLDGEAMSRSELAESVERACNEYAKALGRAGEVCGTVVRAEIKQVISSMREEAGRLAAPPASSAQNSARAVVTPREAQGAAGPASPDPAAIVAAFVQILKAAGVAALIPLGAVPVMQIIETRVDGWMKYSRMLGGFALVLSLVVAVTAGDGTGSFWIGVAAFIGAVVVLLGILEFLNRALVRVVIGRLSDRLGIARDDGVALFKQVLFERTVIRQLGEHGKALGEQVLSNDLNNRVMEAVMLAFINTLLEPVISPSRDIAARREQWRPAKEFAEGTKSTHTALITRCRNFILGVDKLLDNREQIFSTLDRVSASIESTQGSRATS